MAHYDGAKRPRDLDEAVLPLVDGDVISVQQFGEDFVRKVSVSEIGTAKSRITAGETISGHMLLVSIDGLAYLADPTDLTHADAIIGVSKTAAGSGSAIEYIPFGDVAAGSFTQNQTYFAGLNGTLSTSPIAVGAAWMAKVGYAKSSTVLNVQIDPSIILE